VHRIDSVLEALQPVPLRDSADDLRAGDRQLGHIDIALFERLEEVVARQRGLALGRSHVHEHEPVPLFHGVPGLADRVASTAALGLARLLEAVTLRVELHAVVAAADAVVLDSAEVQTRAAVRAPFEHDARLTVAIAEHDEVFAEESGAMRVVARQRARDRDRMPVAAHRFAHRRAR
jgi:hypothetical protein